MSTNDKDKVNDLFQTFQKEREQAPQAKRNAIMNELHSDASEPLISAESQEEQAVLDQYRQFMNERDDSREAIITDVTAYAKSQVEEQVQEQPQTEAVTGGLSRLFSLPSQALGGVTRWVSGLFESGSQWQLAIPALAMVGVVIWLSQAVEQSAPEMEAVAWNQSLPAGVAGNAQGILDKIQPSVPATFGFTQQTGKLAIGFELGQAIADIELALAAQSETYLPGMVRRVDKLASHLGLPLLSSQVDVQEDAASLNGIAQRWFGDNKEFTALYQLGYWMESTQFALQLLEVSDDSSPILEQLSRLEKSRSNWEAALEPHAVQLRQFRKLAKLEASSLETQYGRQMFTRQLERTIAVFKNL